MKHEIGARIYYTGDMANVSDWGTIREIIGGRFGEQVRLVMDNGPDKTIPPSGIGNKYNGTCSPRFVTEDAYNAWHREQMANYQSALA